MLDDTMYNKSIKDFKMEDIKTVNPKFKKHNRKRTKSAQTDELSKGTKRRVNITIDGNVWDLIENLDIESKSKFVEDILKEKLKEAKEL